MAEGEGFEPSVRFRDTATFEVATINHSDNPPSRKSYGGGYRIRTCEPCFRLSSFQLDAIDQLCQPSTFKNADDKREILFLT